MSDDLPYRRGEMRKIFWPAGEPIALLLAVGERGGRDDLAVDEGIVRRHYVIIRNGYVEQRNEARRPARGVPRVGGRPRAEGARSLTT